MIEILIKHQAMDTSTNATALLNDKYLEEKQIEINTNRP